MKTTNRLLAILVLFCLASGSILAQVDELTPMFINYGIVGQKKTQENSAAKLTAVNDTLDLPFVDDFSYAGPYPDASKWINSNSVFVNNGFGLHPKTIGVATFDGLDKNGYPINLLTSIGSWPSDTLLSKPFYLDSTKVLPSDSVYLSFYFESMGFGGDPPEPGDVLMLDLYNPTTGTWPATGTATYTITRPSNNTRYDTKFTRVMMPIKNPQYFKKGFQFRIRNKSTRNGSIDLWHVDNVYLGKNRSVTDTVLKDVAMVYEAKTLLKVYSAMPFKQYAGATSMSDTTGIFVRNNDTSQLGINITGYMEIYDNQNNLVYSQTNGSGDIFPYYNNGYCNVASIAQPQYTYVYNNGNPFTDSTSYLVKHYIKTSAFDANKQNDTILFRQVFNNYFAYDDGTAEAGYQVRAYDGEEAVQYDFAAPDTLQAIDICFNPVAGWDCNNSGGATSPASVLNLTFGLRVWNDNGGQPGSVLYHDSLLQPVYSSNIRYPFYRFKLNPPLLLSGPSTPGTTVPYYFGVKQDECNPINIGFDRNTNSQTKIYYNPQDGFGWHNSSFPGSLMIRPILGDSIRAIDGIREPVLKPGPRFSELSFFPNPANDICTFNAGPGNEHKSYQVQFCNTLGNVVLSEQMRSQQSVSTLQLENGFYVIRILQDGKIVAVRKIIISH